MLSTFRQTSRRLIHEGGFTATILLTLALCIGVNVTIYALVDAILVRPLPFPDADRLVAVHNSYPRAGADRVGASTINYYDRRNAINAFSSVAIQQDGGVIVGGDSSPNRVRIARVSPDFFAMLGVPLARGHMFTDAEMLYGPDQVAVLTDSFWRAHFDADPDIVGRKFFNDGLPVTIIGVLPPGFHFLSSRAEFFRPAAHGPDDLTPANRHNEDYEMIARLAPDATLADAQAQIDAFNQQQLVDDPFAQMLRESGFHTVVALLHADHVRDVRPILLLLQAGVVALLLIGGLNLVNLLLIRANGRTKEFAVRQALGAGRRHVIGEVMMETVMLSLAGGLVGLLLGAFGIDLLSRLGTDRLPLGATVQLDGRVAFIALLGSLIVGVFLALPIVMFNLQHHLAPGLHSESRSGTVSRAVQRVRQGFIIAQISLAFVLLVGAGLLGVSLQKIMSASPGFRPHHVLSGSLVLPWKTYPDPDHRQRFLERLDAALRTQPGISAFGFTSGLPFSGDGGNSAVAVEGVPPAAGKSIRTHNTSFAAGEYWRALGIPLVEGRFLDVADNHREQRVCVVDVDFARRYWPGKSALGHRIAGDFTVTEKNATTIVGVVGSVKQNDLSDTSAPGAVYFSFKDYSTGGFSVVIRTPLTSEAMASTLQKTVLSLDPALPVDNIKSMETLVDDSLVSRRSPAVLAGAFAVIALLMAAIGTYGVIAYTVSQRRREIGVRMALGALPQQVLGQFLKLGVKLLLAGIVLGTAGSWIASCAMQSVLFGVGVADARVLGLTAFTMITVVLVATFIPARRATKVDPLVALRAE